MNMTGWGLMNVNGTAQLSSLEDTVFANIEDSTALEGSTMYWLAPESYLGNRVNNSISYNNQPTL